MDAPKKCTECGSPMVIAIDEPRRRQYDCTQCGLHDVQMATGFDLPPDEATPPNADDD